MLEVTNMQPASTRHAALCGVFRHASRLQHYQSRHIGDQGQRKTAATVSVFITSSGERAPSPPY